MLDLIADAHRAYDRLCRDDAALPFAARGGQIMEVDGEKFVILQNTNGPVAVYRIKGAKVLNVARATAEQWLHVIADGKLIAEA